MDMREREEQTMRWPAAAAAALILCALCGCGQKGALYLPDHAPQPVSSPPALPAVPAEVPPAPSSDSAPAPDTTTRKAPRDPDSATAR
jgi:predicted small lipoprotein YifL